MGKHQIHRCCPKPKTHYEEGQDSKSDQETVFEYRAIQNGIDVLGGATIEHGHLEIPNKMGVYSNFVTCFDDASDQGS